MNPHRKFVVGVTGGIGSGKSAACAVFEELGITVVDADQAARVVVQPGTEGLQKIAAHFGDGVIQIDGTLDRAAMRRLVFENPDERQWLERLLHPLIGIEISRGIQAATSPYVILASPLLLEARQNTLADRVLVIDVSEETQLQRAMARDDNSEPQVRAIIASQIDRQSRLAAADDVIENDGSLAALREKVIALHERYLELAAEHDEKARS
jgi:dephospho-CoA kinase